MKAFLFVGLGNPGPRYNHTRHNIGFSWIDRVCELFPNVGWQERFEAHWLHVPFGDIEVHLLKPMTFMNISGKSVLAWKKKFQADSRTLVVMDDLDLGLGTLRLRPSGGDGGHKGLRSIMECLGTENIARLRLGVGRPQTEAKDYVLEKFSPKEREIVEELMDAVPEHFEILCRESFDSAMNKINAWRSKLAKADAELQKDNE